METNFRMVGWCKQTGILVQINWKKLASYAFIRRIAHDLSCVYCKKLVDVYEKYPGDLELYVTSRLSKVFLC